MGMMSGRPAGALEIIASRERVRANMTAHGAQTTGDREAAARMAAFTRAPGRRLGHHRSRRDVLVPPQDVVRVVPALESLQARECLVAERGAHAFDRLL